MAGLGQAVWSPDPPGYMLEKTVEYLLLAVMVALAEETFFRGVVFRAMLTDWGPCRALVVSSTVYAVLHCISGSYWATPGLQLGVGLDLLKAYFTDGAGSLLPDLRLVVGLFLLGVLLAYLYLRTGSLWASIGFHSGLVLTSKLMKKMVNRAEGFPSWLLGDYQFLVSGAACWAILVAVIMAVVAFAPRGALYRRRLRPTGSQG
jgi:membrane protease YdiL (CAAX protease family)